MNSSMIAIPQILNPKTNKWVSIRRTDYDSWTSDTFAPARNDLFVLVIARDDDFISHIKASDYQDRGLPPNVDIRTRRHFSRPSVTGQSWITSEELESVMEDYRECCYMWIEAKLYEAINKKMAITTLLDVAVMKDKYMNHLILDSDDTDDGQTVEWEEWIAMDQQSKVAHMKDGPVYIALPVTVPPEGGWMTFNRFSSPLNPEMHIRYIFGLTAKEV